MCSRWRSWWPLPDRTTGAGPRRIGPSTDCWPNAPAGDDRSDPVLLAGRQSLDICRGDRRNLTWHKALVAFDYGCKAVVTVARQVWSRTCARPTGRRSIQAPSRSKDLLILASRPPEKRTISGYSGETGQSVGLATHQGPVIGAKSRPPSATMSNSDWKRPDAFGKACTRSNGRHGAADGPGSRHFFPQDDRLSVRDRWSPRWRPQRPAVGVGCSALVMSWLMSVVNSRRPRAR